jgi:hypothetical protein
VRTAQHSGMLALAALPAPHAGADARRPAPPPPAVVRFVPRAGSKPLLGLLVPQPGSATVAEHFVMQVLPYDNDLRLHYWSPLKDMGAGEPSEEQRRAAQELVRGLGGRGRSRSACWPAGPAARPVLRRAAPGAAASTAFPARPAHCCLTSPSPLRPITHTHRR